MNIGGNDQGGYGVVGTVNIDAPERSRRGIAVVHLDKALVDVHDPVFDDAVPFIDGELPFAVGVARLR